MPYRKGRFLFPVPFKPQPRQRHVIASEMHLRATTHTFGARAFAEPREADVIDTKGRRRRIRYKARIPFGRKRTKFILVDGSAVVARYTRDLPQIA